LRFIRIEKARSECLAVGFISRASIEAMPNKGMEPIRCASASGSGSCLALNGCFLAFTYYSLEILDRLFLAESRGL
jgi:hypothetical protein